MKIQEINHHQKSVNKIIFNKAGTVFATCSDDHLIHIYNAFNFQLIRTYGMDNAVKNILFLNKEDKLIASNSLGTFGVYSYFEENDTPFYIHKNNDKRNIDLSSSYGDKYLAILSLRLFEDDDKED